MDNLRVLRDSGCQSNFILESIADELTLPVVRNLTLKVNGFNSSKIYDTKIVKVTIKIGDKTYKIEAICIPSIETTLRLPGLSKIVEAFTNKGFILADKNLSDDHITNIQFILGSNSAYCLNERQVNFGNSVEEPSTYSMTPAGIMLMGNISTILKNLDYLPYSEEMHSKISSDSREEISFLQSVNSNSLSKDPLFAKKNYSSEPQVMVVGGPEDIKVNTLECALEDLLENQCNKILNYDASSYKEDTVENHDKISLGDVVLLKEDYHKPINYPMGIVKKIITNINNEVTGAEILK